MHVSRPNVVQPFLDVYLGLLVISTTSLCINSCNIAFLLSRDRQGQLGLLEQQESVDLEVKAALQVWMVLLDHLAQWGHLGLTERKENEARLVLMVPKVMLDYLDYREWWALQEDLVKEVSWVLWVHLEKMEMLDHEVN